MGAVGGTDQPPQERVGKSGNLGFHPDDWDDERIAAFINSENKVRRHVTVGQLAFIGTEQEPYYAEIAKQRMLAGVKDPEADRPQGSETKRAPQARDLAAKAVGTSGRSISRAKRIAKESPELAAKVKAGEMSLLRFSGFTPSDLG